MTTRKIENVPLNRWQKKPWITPGDNVVRGRAKRLGLNYVHKEKKREDTRKEKKITL